jgi:hypothetical protein
MEEGAWLHMVENDRERDELARLADAELVVRDGRGLLAYWLTGSPLIRKRAATHPERSACR